MPLGTCSIDAEVEEIVLHRFLQQNRVLVLQIRAMVSVGLEANHVVPLSADLLLILLDEILRWTLSLFRRRPAQDLFFVNRTRVVLAHLGRMSVCHSAIENASDVFFLVYLHHLLRLGQLHSLILHLTLISYPNASL